VRLGEDPAGQKIESRARAVETFGSVVPPFLLHKKAALKPRPYVEVERHLLVNGKRGCMASRSTLSTGAPSPLC
jgi:hypothetical protein